MLPVQGNIYLIHANGCVDELTCDVWNKSFCQSLRPLFLCNQYGDIWGHGGA